MMELRYKEEMMHLGHQLNCVRKGEFELKHGLLVLLFNVYFRNERYYHGTDRC